MTKAGYQIKKSQQIQKLYASQFDKVITRIAFLVIISYMCLKKCIIFVSKQRIFFLSF